MKTFIGSGFVMTTLLFVGACSSSGPAAIGNQSGGTWGSAGAAGTGDAIGGTYGTSTGGAAGGSGGAVTGGGLGGAAWLTPATIPPALAVPAGATVKAHVYALGSQIYTCSASAADAGTQTYAWTLKAPDAKLFDADGVQVGTHGAGPHWTWNDGSVAIGMKVAGVDATVAGSIQWLLLRVSSTSGDGVFSDVTFVERLNTNGGAAPATGCDATTAGTDMPVGYSADYYFYVGGTETLGT
jgi:hypothetical protein